MSLRMNQALKLSITEGFKNTPLRDDPSESLKTGFQDVDEELIKSEDL